MSGQLFLIEKCSYYVNVFALSIIMVLSGERKFWIKLNDNYDYFCIFIYFYPEQFHLKSIFLLMKVKKVVLKMQDICFMPHNEITFQEKTCSTCLGR